MRRLTAVLVTVCAGLVGATSAAADDGGPGAGAPSGDGAPPAATRAARTSDVSLMARLTGDQQPPGKDGAATGDRDGRAIALVKVQGDRVTFALSWNGVDSPARAHLHQGAPGSQGPSVAALFAEPVPSSAYSVAGQTALPSALAERLRNDPDDFYVDLHTEALPGGAVRGQLRPSAQPVNPLTIIRGGRLRALADGGQELPSGDPDGHATAFLHPRPDRIDYSLAWVNTGPPLTGNIHEGRLGENGDVRLPLFVTPLPENVFAVSGSVDAPDASMIARLTDDPTGFYVNLTTRNFPDGAVRGQAFR
ncbi:CHRD domain-containing protein [Streptomyces sp. NPDC094049]|uniref:CHRD domain-containing protein n=1 Tax=Streptomyces sp. NPDC094049 TaxID=3154987 RepID=UPI003322DA03